MPTPTYKYNDLVALLNTLISSNVKLSSASINQVIAKILSTVYLIDIVDDDAARNSISTINKHAAKLVYVKSDNSLNLLNHDLSTWRKFTLSGLTEAQITALLLLKVDKVTGKGLSTNDFTNDLLTKLNGIDEGATKVDEIDDVPGLTEALEDLGRFKTLYDETGDFQLTYGYKFIYIDASDGDIELTLPDTIEDNSIMTDFIFKRIDNSVNSVTVIPFDSDESTSDSMQLIEEFNSLSIQPGESYSINSINNKWYIHSKYTP